MTFFWLYCQLTRKLLFHIFKKVSEFVIHCGTVGNILIVMQWPHYTLPLLLCIENFLVFCAKLVHSWNNGWAESDEGKIREIERHEASRQENESLCAIKERD